MQKIAEEKMYSVNELAKMLRVSSLTIYRHLYKKEIRAIKAGKQWRIPESEVERIKREGF